MSNKKDIYDVSSYTDEELYNILDISNPTDRELETKINFLINKYANIQNESGYQLAIFFQEIYKHFFFQDEVEGFDPDISFNMEENTPTLTGTAANSLPTEMYTGPDPSLSDTQTTQNNPTTQAPIFGNIYSFSDKTKDAIAPTKVFDYAPDATKTNPLLKQTIKRVISIDSQYRNKTFQPLSTDFTFNLSEPLKDVVSLKLYSVNIPYTWYTISSDYGSNFFYLKGNSPGINQGNYDYQIAIKPGNYGPSDLVTSIYNSIQNLQTQYSDVNFGQTGITYDPITIKMTFTTDIQMVYNESYFNVVFDPTVASFLNLYSPDVISSNSNTYQFNTIYGATQTPDPSLLNPPTTTLDGISAKYSFNIVRYVPLNIKNITSDGLITTPYEFADFSYNYTIIQTIPITFNQTNDIPTLVSNINTALQTSASLLTTSGFALNPATNTYKMTVNLDRKKLNPTMTPNEKVAVVFSNGDSIQQTFGFQLTNELSNIIGTNSITTIDTFILDNNVQIQFRCIRPNYTFNEYRYPIEDYRNFETHYNDFGINIPQGTYSIAQLSNYYNEFFANPGNSATDPLKTNGVIMSGSNMRFPIDTNGNTYSLNTTFKLSKVFDQSKYVLNVDMKNFYNQNYPIIYDKNTNDLTTYLGFNNSYDLSQTNTIVSYIPPYLLDIAYSQTPLVVYPIIFTFRPNAAVINGIQEDNDVTQSYLQIKLIPRKFTDINGTLRTFGIPQQDNFGRIKSYTYNNEDFTDLINDINYTFQQNVNSDPHYDYSKSSIVYDSVNQKVTLTFILTNTLTQADYTVSFIDTPNTNNQDITQPLNMWEWFGIPSTPFDLSRNSVITGSVLPIYQRYLPESNIQFFIGSNLNGVETANQFSITIPPQNYSISSFMNIVNTALNTASSSNPTIAYNSNFYLQPYTEYNAKSVTRYNNLKIRMNINKIYTSKDYNLVFYDPFSFIKCYVGASSVSNTTWDNTLGWILGFRDYTTYTLIKSNLTLTTANVALTNNVYLQSYNGAYSYLEHPDTFPNNNNIVKTVITLTGDTTVTTNLYNYFLIVLDDFIQNHLNDGLVTICKPETQLPTQSYAYRANRVCDPITKQVVSLGTSNVPANGLTQNQIYALNAIQISKQTNNNYNLNYSKGPYVQDIFGIIPIKTAGLQTGQYFVEFGGTLQIQERQYFGPVNIHRMHIQLINDKGSTLNLNNSDWSFSLICEQLYTSTLT